jgi:gamma-glutamyltranspeptidase / glutathione hydrolase
VKRSYIALNSVALAVILSACASAPNSAKDTVIFNYSPPLQPEGASGYTDKPGWATSKFAVAAANPLATNAGYQVLKAGGSAVDAAIAVQMVLGLVEPQSSGIGGGAFLLHHDSKTTQAFDGRETAPAGVTEQLFIKADGKPMAFIEGVVGGRSVGAMGTVHMLEIAHRQHGKLPWAQLFRPAIRLATDGFKVSYRLHKLLSNEEQLKKDPVAAAYFYDAQSKAWPVGHVLQNPEYAAVLQRIAAQGAQALSQGEFAEATVKKVQQHPSNPGKLSLADLANYQTKLRDPLCHDYSATSREYRICGMPPPSSGAIAVGQILGILNETNAARLPLDQSNYTPSADWLHLYTEASRLAFADRAQYVADPDFVSAPSGSWASLLAPDYLASRAKLIGPQANKAPAAGKPSGAKTAYAPMPDQPEYGTSHISIIDGWGNALSMTTTIEDAFGARQMVNRGKGLAGGFLLNNELTDFSFAPTDAAGSPIANRVQPGKRPRSSMSPTLVFDKATGQVVMSAGSPGGSLIIHYTAKTLYGVLNWGLNTQQAINLPNFAATGAPSLLEEKRFPPATIDALKARGHEVREQALTSGLQAIQRTTVGFFGGADPRREGVVMGD